MRLLSLVVMGAWLVVSPVALAQEADPPPEEEIGEVTLPGEDGGETSALMSGPTVTLTSPSQDDVVATPGSFTLTASTTSSYGIVSVEFYSNGNLVGTDFTAPYTRSISNLTANGYTFTAVATDTADQTAESAPVSVIVTVPPTVALTAPVSGASGQAPASFSLAASASDADGTISSVQFHANDVLFATDTTAPYTAKYVGAEAGTVVLKAKAFDNYGISTLSSGVSITVLPPNVPPTVAITAPSTGSFAYAPATLGLTATASDSDGTIANVKFYANGVLKHTGTTVPYVYAYNTSVAGYHTLTVEATDNAGAVSSRSVGVTIAPAGVVSARRSYVYDANQRLCKLIEPERGAAVMHYDAAGNLDWSATAQAVLSTTTCDHEAVTSTAKTTRTYDARNRLKVVDVPGTTSDATYDYFPDGSLKSLVNGLSGASGTANWEYTYNRRGMPLTEKLVYNGTRTLTHTYNANGHEQSLTYPSGVVLAQDPNALGQPTRAGGYAHTVTYHPNGGMSGFTYNNGIVHSLTQNTRDLPVRSLDKKAGQDAVLDDTYSYDANGNVLSILDASGLGGGTRQGILYDELDRLQYVDAPNQSWESLTTYDALDNIRSNEVGSRLWTYAYNANNRLATLTKQDGTNPPTVATVTHDPNGNLTGNGIDTYTYDIVNRLQQVVGKESYVYDGHGRRVQIKRLSDNKIAYPFYSLDGKLITEDDNRSNLHSDFVYLNGSLVAKLTKPIGTSTWTFTYLHTDALGSPVVETSSTGDIIDSTKYKPYGEPSEYKQAPGFTGHVTDALTGLSYMQQRYYDPVLGRFLSVDPFPTDTSTGDEFNRYVYAGNNPYKFVDPDGRARVRFALAVLRALLGGKTTLHRSGARPTQTTKRVPNPNGSKGKEDHQKKVAELADKAKGEARQGERVVTERKIQKEESNRRPDVQIIDKDGNTRKVFEAERNPASKRNLEREAEYDKLGVEHETHPVGGEAPTTGGQ
jgi:RHS repeat-associated protein